MLINFLLVTILLFWISAYYFAQRESRFTLLADHSAEMRSNLPMISIIIPARNEEQELPYCLNSLANLDYPHYEVIVIDDHSDDRTYEVADSFRKLLSACQIIKSEDLPQGWTGKNWANYQGAQKAKGEWLLFTDADAEFFSNAVFDSISYAEKEGLDMLSLAPKSEFVNFWDKITFPLMGGVISASAPLSKVNNPDSSKASAVGAFIFIRNSVYKTIGSHAAIQGRIVDDLALSVLVKSKGFKLRLLNGVNQYKVQMYHNFKELWEGWGKNMFVGIKCNHILALFQVMLIFYFIISPFLLLFVWHGLFVFSVDLIIIGLYTSIQKKFNNDFSAVYGLSLPLGAVLVIGIVFNAVIRYHKGISWKGRIYNKSKCSL